MTEVSHHLANDSTSFHPVHTLIKAVGPPDLHHPKGRGLEKGIERIRLVRPKDLSKLFQPLAGVSKRTSLPRRSANIPQTIYSRPPMFVAAYDDRHVLPDYFIPFCRNASAFCDLHLITPAKKLPEGTKLDSGSSELKFQLIDPASLPAYQYVKQLFDGMFVNYSTNHDAFERACFHRWFALNASTTFLSSNDYICLLDTDFLIGMSPSEVLSQCLSRAENKDIKFVAEWDDAHTVAIGPEITIMTKSFLYGFCEYLLTTYFSPSKKSQLLREYFERIGNGLDGGICDMRALAAYSKLNHCGSVFNLRKLADPQIIGNFNAFLDTEAGKTGNWKILLQANRQTLQVPSESKQLIGIHFQGSAKAYMLLACVMNSMDGEITRDICTEHLKLLARKMEVNQTLIKRAAKKLKRGVGHFF